MINQVTATGKMSKEEIYNNWNALWYKIIFALEDNFFDEGNTYQIINKHRISDIATYCLSFNSMSSGALDGFKMTKVSDSEITQRLIKSGYEVTPEKKGILGSIFGGRKKLVE